MLKRIFLAMGLLLMYHQTLGQAPTLSEGRGGCQQQYNFFMKAQFSDLFWIGESLAGNCLSSKLIQVLIQPNSPPQVISLELTDYNRWYWVESADGYLRDEIVVPLDPKRECLISNSSKLTVKPPTFNAEMFKLYREEAGSACGEAILNMVGEESIDLPRIKDRTAELIYYHPKGIYFNYKLAAAYYFPDTQYLLVFTEREMRCMGNDTAHGFLILKLKRNG